MIIAFGYEKQVGKDTACAYLQSMGFEHFKFATPLKELSASLLGVAVSDFEDNDFKWSELPWQHQKRGRITYRQYLEQLGEHLRSFDEDVFVKKVLNDIEDKKFVCISDMRHVNEFTAISAIGGITVKIVRNTGIPKTHITDIALDNFIFDYIIYNNGTIKELQQKIWRIVQAHVSNL